MTKTLSELAQYVGGRVLGDANVKISSAATLGRAGAGDISFLSNDKYEKQLLTTKASAVIVGKDTVAAGGVPLLVAEDPYYAFMQIMVLLHGHRKAQESRHKSPRYYFRQRQNRRRLPNPRFCHNLRRRKNRRRLRDLSLHIHRRKCSDRQRLLLYPNVVIYEGCRIGSRVIINSNATIGEDGFGFATHNGVHHKIPQIGCVVIEDDVEIGACCGIERGTLNDTIIGQGSKLGDLIAIGHGTKVGPHCLLVAQVGIAGSTTLGHHCIVGGQAGIVGHINIGNQVAIGAQAGVINNVSDGKVIVGAPAIDAGQGKRAYGMIQYLPEMKQSIRELAGADEAAFIRRRR